MSPVYLSEGGGRCSAEAAMYLSLLVCAKAAGKKSLPHTGRLWPAFEEPGDQTLERSEVRTLQQETEECSGGWHMN